MSVSSFRWSPRTQAFFLPAVAPSLDGELFLACTCLLQILQYHDFSSMEVYLAHTELPSTLRWELIWVTTVWRRDHSRASLAERSQKKRVWSRSKVTLLCPDSTFAQSGQLHRESLPWPGTSLAAQFHFLSPNVNPSSSCLVLREFGEPALH